MNTRKSSNAEEILRQVARLSAPEGLEERLTAQLRAAMRSTPSSSGIAVRLNAVLRGWQFFFMESQPLRAAAAVAIAAAVLGGGWTLARQTAPADMARHQQPVQPMQLSTPSSGGFSTAGTMRVPETLQGPVISDVRQKSATVPDKSSPPERGKAKKIAERE
jgi:hypothetical protein